MPRDWSAQAADERLRMVLPQVAAALQALGIPGTKLREKDLEQAMVDVLSEAYPGHVRKNRKVPISGFFPNVGNVDLLVDRVPGQTFCWLGELKWSYGTPDKIFEAAWDAVKLALAAHQYAKTVTRCWLVTGAPPQSWAKTCCADLFENGEIDVQELWQRPLVPRRGPNNGATVGEDLEIGGGANMFIRAPRLRVSRVADIAFLCGDEAWELRASSVEPAEPWIDPFTRATQ